MAQYDLLLTQNVHDSGIEFSEKYVNIAKGGLLSALANGTPSVLAAGTNGYILKRNDTTDTGLEWVAQETGHTQNTDTGTTSQTFQLHSANDGGKLKAESSTKFGVKNAADNAYIDLQALGITASSISLTTGTISTAPNNATDIANKTYVDGLLAANDAMIFKGTIGSGGTVETLPTTHDIGWTYKVTTAATYAGKVCEVGDMLISMAKRTGSGNQNTDWAVVQANIDGAVTGPAGAISVENIALWNSNNRSLKDSGVLLSSLATTANLNDYITKTTLNSANTIMYATSANTPAALPVGASTFVGRKSTGNIDALSAAEARTILNVADGANNYSHPNHTGDVTSVADGATTIATGAVTLSKMANVATGTVFYRKTASTGVPEVQTLATLKTDLGNMPIDWVSAPATKTSTGAAGQAAYDSNFLYVCTEANVWKRSVLATNW